MRLTTDGRTAFCQERVNTNARKSEERERETAILLLLLPRKRWLCHYDACSAAGSRRQRRRQPTLAPPKPGVIGIGRRTDAPSVACLPVESISDMQEETAERRRRQGRTGRGRTTEHDGRVRTWDGYDDEEALDDDDGGDGGDISNNGAATTTMAAATTRTTTTTTSLTKRGKRSNVWKITIRTGGRENGMTRTPV